VTVIYIDTYYPIGDNNIWLYLLCVAVLESLPAYLWQFRNSPGTMPLIYAQICKGAMLLLLVFASMSKDLLSKVFWISLYQLPLILLSYVWFMFMIQISGQAEKIPRKVHYVASGFIALLWLAILSNSWHGWFWSEVRLDGGNLLGVRGPLFWLVLGCCYTLNLINFGLNVRWVLTTYGLRRRQAITILISPLFTLIPHLVALMPGDKLYSPYPVGFLLSGIYITWAYQRLFIFNILPQAQKAVVQNMIDGLLIIDEEGYIVEMNPVAKKMFTDLTADVGGKFSEFVAVWPALGEVGSYTSAQILEAAWDYPRGRCYYQLNMTPLISQGNLLGKVIFIKDITQQKQIQDQLMEQEKALSIMVERDRLGREIHDGRGQIWNYINLELQTTRSLLNGGRIEEVGKQIDQLIGIVKELNVEVRESIVGLKRGPSSSHDFITNLQNYLAWYEKNNGIATRLILPTESIVNLFSHTIEVQLLRIIQEALTNIRKHAKAQQALVMIKKVDGQVTVIIEDDGCGFDMEFIPSVNQSFGLHIMTERAEEAGGCLQIESKPGVGTKVMIHFLREKVESNENAVS